MKFNFECPKCKYTKLEEIHDHCIVCYPIQVLDDEEFEYGEPQVLDSTLQRIQCSYCGFIIRDLKGTVINDYNIAIDILKEGAFLKC